MKKDFTRDYTTEIFRLYAAMGKPTYERAQSDIYETELLRRSDLNPQTAIAQAERAVENATPLLLDVMAAERTIELLERGNKSHIVSAVSAVYFADPKSPLRRGDISARVHHFSLMCPTDERTVYRWLKEARLLCAAIRGLRISATDMQKYRL